jgi:hypothetical protein
MEVTMSQLVINQIKHHPLQKGMGFALFTAGLVTLLADLAHSF